jgi:hypothetical protein
VDQRLLTKLCAAPLRCIDSRALRELGWVEGQNLIIDYAYAEGRFDRLSALMAELLRAKPDVILAQGDERPRGMLETRRGCREWLAHRWMGDAAASVHGNRRADSHWFGGHRRD